MLRLLVLFCAPSLLFSQSLVLIGGLFTDENAPVWNKIVQLAGGEGVARIGVFTAAAVAADVEEEAAHYVDVLTNTYKAKSAVFIPVTANNGNSNSQEVADLILQQTGFFFGGGSRVRLLRAMRNSDGSDTLALAALRTVFQNGAVISGTSAGAGSMTKTFMISSGLSFDALVLGAFSGGYDSSFPDRLSYDQNGGLGFFQKYVVDTHFSERGREGRLIRMIQDTKSIPGGTPLGLGIDEDTAFVVYNVGSNGEVGEVIGTNGGVTIVDVTTVDSLPSDTTEFRGVKTAVLTSGDQLDLTTGEITIASWKVPFAGSEEFPNAYSSQDIFSVKTPGEFRRVVSQLLSNKFDKIVSSYSCEVDPVQFEVVMGSSNSSVYGGYLPDGTFIISHTNLCIDIGKRAFSGIQC